MPLKRSAVRAPSGSRHEGHSEKAYEGAHPGPRRPGLASRAQALEEHDPEGHRGHDEGGDARRDGALRGHDEPVADGQEQDPRDGIVEGQALRGPTVLAVGEERDPRHDQPRREEAQGGRGEGRHLAHHDADGQVG